MSIKVMSQVWAEGPNSASERLLLLALADFADDNGVCWPSMETIAEKACMSERNARRVVRKLESEGYLETMPSSGRASNRRVAFRNR